SGPPGQSVRTPGSI
ncbi:hypothetical protein S40285_09171, partial [Stachybotrys chlorohalonatus IBT 40285]